jgi:hypothetical protein
VRYSFHGKVRATGQQVDGFVEAANATQAIDRLADQGIIGVYTVRPDPKPPKNAVILAGQEPPEMDEPAQRPRLERSSKRYAPPVQPPIAPAQPAPAQQLPAQVVASTPATDAVLATLVDKVSMLMTQVEKLLSRPATVVYQSGPARGGGGGGGSKKSRMPNDAQNSTLRDIFLNNMDLRKSLEKLATTVGPGPAPVAGASSVPSAGSVGAVAGPVGPRASSNDAVDNSADGSGDDLGVGDSGDDSSIGHRDSVSNGHTLIQSQPAA